MSIIFLLNTSSLEDIKSFKVTLENKDYSKKELLESYYKFLKHQQKRKLEIEEKLEDFNSLKRIFRIVFLILGLVIGVVSLSVLSNINIFLVETVGLFMISIYSFYKIIDFQKNKPSIQKKGLFYFLGRLFKKFYTKNKYLFENNFMFLYFFLLSQSLAMLFSVGLALGYILGFFFTHIDFSYESTFNLTPEIENQIIYFFTTPWNFLCNCATPDILLQKSGTVLVLFIIFTMFFWGILPRIIIYMYGRFLVLPKLGWLYLEIFAQEKGFFDEVSKISEIKSNKNNQEYKIIKEEVYEKYEEQKLESDERYLLFYRSKKNLDIDLDMIDNCKIRYFAYFKQNEKEKYSILNELKGVVYLVIKPDILPDNKFKQYLTNMLKNGNISKIYIVLLDFSGDRYKLANKKYDNYLPWLEEIEKFGSKVDIYLKEKI